MKHHWYIVARCVTKGNSAKVEYHDLVGGWIKNQEWAYCYTTKRRAMLQAKKVKGYVIKVTEETVRTMEYIGRKDTWDGV